jgi:predicted dehydrogenase
LLEYPDYPEGKKVKIIPISSGIGKPVSIINQVNVGFIGAGNFAQSYLLPNLKKIANVNLRMVVDGSPLAAKNAAQKFGFTTASADSGDILNSKDIDAVFIATRHDSHGPLLLSALRSGKKVYIEKPLAIREDQVAEIADFIRQNPASFLMVGFNRRFSKPIVLLREYFGEIEGPLLMNYRVNAGPLAKEHWLWDPDQGGRIIGEGCHFIDTMAFIADSEVKSVFARSIRQNSRSVVDFDNMTAVLQFENGSIGTLSYFATGDARFPKEYFEVFGGGKAAVLDDFRLLRISQFGKKKKLKFEGGKGYKEEMNAVICSILKGKESPIPFSAIYNTTQTTLAIIRSLEAGTVKEISH